MKTQREQNENFGFHLWLSLLGLALLFTVTTCAKGAEPASKPARANAVLLDFTAAWCGPCQSMAPVIDRLQADGYAVRRINIDAEQSLAQQLNVKGVPTFVMTVDGQETARIVGSCNRSALVAMYKSVPAASTAAEPADCEYRIYAPLGGGHGAYGSGTAIAPRLVVTAAHVVDRKKIKNLTLTGPDNAKYTGDCVAIGKSADVALILTNTDLPGSVPLAVKDVPKGAKITAVGYGHAGVLREGNGTISGRTFLQGHVTGDVTIESGDSGGGLFDASGELCGVLIACDGSQSTTAYDSGEFFAEPVSKVISLCKAYEAQCPDGQCPIAPQYGDASGTSNPMVPVQPRPMMQPQYVQPPQYYVYPAPAPVAPAPQIAPAPIPAPIDTAPLEAKFDKGLKRIEGKIDDLTDQAKKITDANALIAPKMDAANAQIKGLAEGPASIDVKAKSIVESVKTEFDTKVVPHLGKFGADLQATNAKLLEVASNPIVKGAVETGLPTFLQWILGVAGVGTGGGAIVVLVTMALKIMGVVGQAQGSTPTPSPADVAQQIGAVIAQQIAASKGQPGGDGLASLLAKLMVPLGQVGQFVTQLQNGLTAGQQSPAANPTTTAGT